MKKFRLFTFGCAALMAAATALAQEAKVYTARFEENIPYGVLGWHQSERVKKGVGKETRFGPYDKGSATELTNDALVDRGAGEATQADPRETAFYQAFDEKGWYIYIEAKEPMVRELVHKLVDPRSPGHNESYELFFTSGLEGVPYYQVFINPYQNRVRFFDWGMPSAEYRSLKDGTHVESLPLKDGIGTFVFIPWHLLYERAPMEGGEWRFSLIRWMPYAKAGGVTWGGQVHETGRFGRVNFPKPNEKQREAMERRLIEYGWYKFQANAARLDEYWNDAHIGDPAFYEARLKPEIDRLNAIAKGKTDTDQWTPEQFREGARALKDLMEFDYKVADLRGSYLRQKRLSED